MVIYSIILVSGAYISIYVYILQIFSLIGYYKPLKIVLCYIE